MTKGKILVVEDEIQIAGKIAKYLAKNDYKPIVLNSGELVVETVKTEFPDLIVLDIMLPVKDGIECCKEIRSFTNTPIIMLTAKKSENDRVLGLRLGADDYVCKPFSAKELILRIDAIVRRCSIKKPTIQDGIFLDKEGYVLKKLDKKVNLTRLEFSLFSLLYNRPGRIFSRGQIIELAYKTEKDISERAIDSHVKNIRKKVKAIGIEQNIIETIYGEGFKYIPPD